MAESSSTPTRTPQRLPRPPEIATPPTTAAAMACISRPVPVFGSTSAKRMALSRAARPTSAPIAANTLKVTADGYIWEVPAGPGAIVRYTAVYKDGLWVETGEMIAGDKPGVKVFEMDLRRVSDTDWPAAGAVPMK